MRPPSADRDERVLLRGLGGPGVPAGHLASRTSCPLYSREFPMVELNFSYYQQPQRAHAGTDGRRHAGRVSLCAESAPQHDARDRGKLGEGHRRLPRRGPAPGGLTGAWPPCSSSFRTASPTPRSPATRLADALREARRSAPCRGVPQERLAEGTGLRGSSPRGASPGERGRAGSSPAPAPDHGDHGAASGTSGFTDATRPTGGRGQRLPLRLPVQHGGAAEWVDSDQGNPCAGAGAPPVLQQPLEGKRGTERPGHAAAPGRAGLM